MGKCGITLFMQNHKTTQDTCKITHIELDHQEKCSILEQRMERNYSSVVQGCLYMVGCIWIINPFKVWDDNP